MGTILVFCGLPGSGKSTKAEEFKRFYGESVEVVSTDAIREEVFGDIHTQEHNTEVFNIAYERIKEFSETKEVVIFDATNTTMKSRKRIFNCGIDRKKHEIVCVVFNTPFRECIIRDSKRSKYVGKKVIEKFYNSFQIPFREEGWDRIIYGGNIIVDGIRDFFLEMIGFDQETKWHTLSLDEHCKKVCSNLKEEETYNRIVNKEKQGFYMIVAAYLHDYGKLFTQTFSEDGQAHYYNHANVGTYELFSKGLIDLDVLFYINYHMLPFNWNSKKTINKYNNIFGVEKTSNLLLLNECDRKGK